jgi:hypothetical protein
MPENVPVQARYRVLLRHAVRPLPFHAGARQDLRCVYIVVATLPHSCWPCRIYYIILRVGTHDSHIVEQRQRYMVLSLSAPYQLLTVDRRIYREISALYRGGKRDGVPF